MNQIIEIMDTSLRDGEQTSGVSFSPQEKLAMAKFLLLELKVDRIEVASARVSSGEKEAVKLITNWAQEEGLLSKVEVLGFVDEPHSVNWLVDANCMTMNLLCKGSINHLLHQLKKTEKEHIEDIASNVAYAQDHGIAVNIYLEDWSNGMQNSKDYVLNLIAALSKMPIERIMLPDTLGVLSPQQTATFCKEVVAAFPNVHFDFHAHNDYGLAVANVLEAVSAGVNGIHATINGLGERSGNVSLSAAMAALEDHMKISFNANEKKMFAASKLMESFSGIRVPVNKPVIGANVFTQTAGIHADGDQKNNLYHSKLAPERFGRKRKYALGKLSGKANVAKNLEAYGLSLNDAELKKVTRRIIELGDNKESVTAADLPFIIADVLESDSVSNLVTIDNYSMSFAKGLKPTVFLKLKIDKAIHEDSASGFGQYDAFMNAVRKIYNRLEWTLPELIDYEVSIPPGGKTDALVETRITWNNAGKNIITRGLNPDQTVAAIDATLKMLNMANQQTIKKPTKAISI